MKTKPTFLLAVFVLVATMVLTGQNVSDTERSQMLTQSPVYREIQGCLAFNGVSYVVAVVSNGPKQYRVVGGETALLRGKVGHTVEIDGQAGSNNPAEMVRNWDMREATTGVGWYTITADKVHDVTSNCSYPGFERPLTHVAPEYD